MVPDPWKDTARPRRAVGGVQARGWEEQRARGGKEFPEAQPGSDGQLDRCPPTGQTRSAGAPSASPGWAHGLRDRSPSQLKTGRNLREVSSTPQEAGHKLSPGVPDPDTSHLCLGRTLRGRSRARMQQEGVH